MPKTTFSKKLCAGILSALLLFLSPAIAQKHNASKTRMDSERLARIPDRMKSFVEQGAIAGAVILIAKGGQVVSLKAVGFQDLESKKPMRTDTIFDIRSLTKPVTAIGIVILMEEGRLALNDPVEKYLPEFKAATPPKEGQRSPITIRHLLTHTTGMPFNRPLEIENITIKRDRSLADVVAILSKQEPEFEPGKQYRYYSGGFAILGRIIEVVSGEPYEQFIKQRIFDPLGMKDSFFSIPAEKQSRVASIYRLHNGKLNKWEEIMAYRQNAKYPGPEFGMYSTASDLASLCQMMLNGGTLKDKRILSAMSVKAMTEKQTTDIKSAITQRMAYQGLGWGLSGDPMNDFPLTSPGSFGHNGAFGTIFWVDPNEELIRIFLAQLFGLGNEIDIFMAMAGSAVAN
ncbi:MAG: beta-lactamase family protein [Pyrinomonadaceae bacterium]|nr:beta-lactamase family protein [Pyrinomonadaceae bacterium]